MSEDYHDKTEPPTPKRLAEARQKGYVAKSQDVIVSFHLIMCMVVFFFFVDYMFSVLASINISIFNNLNLQFADINFISFFLNKGLIQIFFILLPLIVGGFVISFIMNLIQTGLVYSFYPLMPKWNKLNVFNTSNYERNFGVQALIRLGFGLIRLQLVLFLCVLVVGQNAFQVFALGKVPIQEMVAFIKRECILVGFSIGAAYLVVAICDYFYQNWIFIRKLRMSKREVKDEIKQVEGDQNIKNKIRAAMRTFARANIVKDMSKVDILIFDNRRFVVAISYKNNLPVCVSKGTGRKALIMLEIAKTYGIPILENPLLTEKLFKDAEIEAPIKQEYYQEIIIALVQRKNTIEV